MLKVINCRKTKIKDIIEHLYTLPIDEEVLLVLWNGSIIKHLPKEHIRILTNINVNKEKLIDFY